MDKQIEKKENNESLKELILAFIASNDTLKKVGKEKIEMAVKIALTNRLNPLKKEVYFIPFKDQEGNYNLTIITGYEVYLKRAEESGRLEYWNVEIIEQNNKPYKAVITIKRKDWQKEFKHEVYYNEVYQNKSIWLKMPRFMLKKVAIAQGFRLCFPDVLAELPYTSDEIGEVIEEKESINEDAPATPEQKNIISKLNIPNVNLETLTISEAKKIIYEYTKT
jgi:phage recombination protein Bet